ncbi:nitrogenase-stabilizing/protective protein [Paraburkholderia sp. BL6669N2]|uniref:nitrogenase-stabilizing/protective protein NifW n=1 Tax=Paraburkholderia sp. BL6669N2 TaxID=1938807 RepID=UPI000E220CFB|nr:nitrogenase-stabilizing/protective protein NifW [Paraburkholderia sp. BL6669N2]REG58737.1 nitrogenase-stabilizing/protective protein [Paraburkholderia sp. BL6669N2]
MLEVIEQLRHLPSAEDFPRFFDIAFDEKVVNVSRLHILKRFFQCIEQQKELPCNNATAVLAVCRCLLQKTDNDFVVSTPAEQKVFKVFLEADGRRLVSVDDLRASLPTRGDA